jgi:hypothetical protein
MKVSIKGVLIGGVVDVVTSTILGLPVAFYAMSRMDPSLIRSPQASKAVADVIHGSLPLYATDLLAGAACSALGGYVAAWIAARDELLNGGLSSYLCVLLGIYTIVTGRDSNPHWLQILLLGSSPLLAVLGGFVMLQVRRARLKTPA